MNPERRVDPSGLSTVTSCGDRTLEVMAAIADAQAQVARCTSVACADAGFTKERWLYALKNLRVYCGGSGPSCGYARGVVWAAVRRQKIPILYNLKTQGFVSGFQTVVYEDMPDSECGCLTATIAHESLHHVQKFFYPYPLHTPLIGELVGDYPGVAGKCVNC
jgi:hypothetical protein